MSGLARANGWRGFDGLAEKVDRVPGVKGSRGGWLYRCDGMPSLRGCAGEVVVPVPYKKVGRKSTGWLVTYGLEPVDDALPLDDPANLVEDHDVVLTFCPSCADEVEKQAKERGW